MQDLNRAGSTAWMMNVYPKRDRRQKIYVAFGHHIPSPIHAPAWFISMTMLGTSSAPMQV
ncbi:hypothetical protein RRF57_010087 [Xylaria bambusicola]|uniref:Uncharacterized protein n=1 Tax=Xylaria bambusicola TaxID=326684 RepID=A0AAN7ZCI4_9PEZI